MSILVAGILKSPTGVIIAGAQITLTALTTSPDLLAGVSASAVTSDTGYYGMNVLPGAYSLTVAVNGKSQVYGSFRLDGAETTVTLNMVLRRNLVEVSIPDELLVGFRQIQNNVADDLETMRWLEQSANQHAQQAARYRDATAKAAESAAMTIPGARLENFNDIVRLCTTAMLKLELPEVVAPSVTFNVKENATFDYTGEIHGYCGITEPEKYKVSMYAYTTGEYANGDASLSPDGTFYFSRCWPGTKQFRLIRIEDNQWVTTLEFPLCIRSYRMPEDADPEVVRVMKDRCYTYDQALAALALMVQRHDAVERYITGLCALVDENGGVKFFVNRLSAMSPRPYYRLGNAAWVFYALAFYLEKYPDGAQAAIVREKLLSGIAWLDTFLVTTPGDLREGLYKGGLGRYVNGEFDASFIAEWCALEHNVDIWFLFELMGRLDFDGFRERAEKLAQNIIRGMWVEEEGRFRQGVHPDQYDNAAALDQSSWGGLFVASIDMAKAAECRKYMGRFLFGTRETTGYTPYHPDYGYPGHSRGVWVEGTAGVALFERKLGNELNAVNLIAAMTPLRDEYGYRDSCDDPIYDVLPPWPSTANTAWVILTVKPDNFWLVDSPEMDVGMIRY
ncbi:TPA: carboxypeptidase regulatory-like domain-containing protein [Salmonella enterica subsp. enterica serovar Napoli]|nr:phage tail protein [Salmonella enterica subsp. enterica serovar Napoli]HBB6984705.1 carboxypeptidase regulatory-like domain-containing protein [Salmonella enterica subsp. enterica serovar Napoli]HBC0333594.1 carboxypeptidase regulatory-like domain-containing protein [Salmonella enterica subsp. enterica serovar Napoli]HBC0354134.1 carboxypeptidase regulatory-like domain-containing protein [Salmonella enterica subsp. enterica serovar Napoli]